MDTSKSDPFDWFELELRAIRSQRFHVFEPVSEAEMFYGSGPGSAALSGDYAAFLRRFGNARLFADHWDSPTVSVCPLKEFRRHECRDGTTFVGFGFRGQQSAFFNEQKILSEGCSAVYTVNAKSGREIATGFATWFESAYLWAKSKYSTSQWKAVVNGPTPFTSDERQVVEARANYCWRHVGFSSAGDAIFEVENRSERQLPFLTIGVRDRKGEILIGGAWLDVSRIAPGTRACVTADCYKESIPATDLETFELPAPIPEKREAYWEFGKPS